MTWKYLVVCAGLAGTVSPPSIARAATEAELRAASSPILLMRSGSNNRYFPSRREGRAVVTVNDKPVDFGNAFVVQVGGRLMVPLRPIGEALGANISYDASTNTVEATRAGFRLTLRDGAYVLGGTTLVPLRTLSQSLAVKLAVTNSADITRIALTPLSSKKAAVTVVSGPLRPARPAQTSNDGDVTDANIQYNLKQLNAIRAKAGAPSLKLDARLNDFAREGSLELMRTHVPHGHFKSADVWKNGFNGTAAENQGDPHGWFPGPVNQSIDQILKAMMAEGPGGGHHDNILNPAFRRVGIGLVKDKNGRLYFTNDFSG